MTEQERLQEALRLQQEEEQRLMEEEAMSQVTPSMVDRAGAFADQEAQELRQANKEAKSPYQQTKKERTADALDNPQISLEDKYKAIMDQYQKEQQKEVKQPGFMDALPDILTGLYNIGVRANPTGLRELQMPNSVAAAKSQAEDQKSKKLQSLDNTRKMIKDLMQVNAQTGKAKSFKVGNQIVQEQDDGSFKPVYTDKTKSVEPTFSEKETIKAEAKATAQEKKENREQRKLATDALPKLNDKLKQIQRAKESLRKYDEFSLNPFRGTGYIQDLTPTITKEGQKVQADFNKLALDEMATIFSGMSKAIDSDAERAFFERTQPSMSNDEQVNMQLLEAMEERLKRNKNVLESQIKNISPKGELKEDPAKEVLQGSQPLKEMVLIQAPDGTKARVPADRAQHYINKGGKLVKE